MMHVIGIVDVLRKSNTSSSCSRDGEIASSSYIMDTKMKINSNVELENNNKWKNVEKELGQEPELIKGINIPIKIEK